MGSRGSEDFDAYAGGLFATKKIDLGVCILFPVGKYDPNNSKGVMCRLNLYTCVSGSAK